MERLIFDHAYSSRKIPTPWICIIFLKVCEPRELIIPGWWGTESGKICFAATFNWCFLSQWCSNNNDCSERLHVHIWKHSWPGFPPSYSRNSQNLYWKTIYSCIYACTSNSGMRACPVESMLFEIQRSPKILNSACSPRMWAVSKRTSEIAFLTLKQVLNIKDTLVSGSYYRPKCLCTSGIMCLSHNVTILVCSTMYHR